MFKKVLTKIKKAWENVKRAKGIQTTVYESPSII